jgi:APA family basic amino acid/polyamine antiporter
MIASTIYVLVAVVAVAAQPWKKFDGQESGLAQILQNVTGSTWPGTVIAVGAKSILSVTLVTLYGQTRILFAMSRDGWCRRCSTRSTTEPSPRSTALSSWPSW